MPNEIVSTKYGKLRGVTGRDASVVVFRGVPFAQPPVGALRWREPQPVIPWAGIRDASQFSAIPVQTYGNFFCSYDFEEIYQSEDCLYLNIWAPKDVNNAPVFVWFYGGSFQGGCGSDPMFDGERFAAQGIVMVTVNYRVGILGYLAHPDMRAESPFGTSGNFGVLDQIAALSWVRENIAFFGGDPETVTIGGQSAGAGSVCDMMTAPMARGLFVRGIIESGDHLMGGVPKTTERHPESIGKALAERLGDGSLESLRALPFTDLVRPNYDAVEALFGRHCSPYADGVILPCSHAEAIDTPRGNNVPLIVGSNRDESFMGIPATGFQSLFAQFGTEAEALAAAYPEGETELETRATVRALGASQWKLRLAAWSELRAEKLQQPTWHYLFCRRPTIGEERLASHSGELAYVFDSFDAYPPLMQEVVGVPANRALAKTVNRYWCNFIKTGDPNGEGLAPWYSKAQAPNQHFRIDEELCMEPDISEERERLLLPSIRRALGME